MRKLFIALISAFALFSCSQSDSITIKGDIELVPDKIYISRVEGIEKVVIDSVLTSKEGRFEYKGSIGGAQLVVLSSNVETQPIVSFFAEDGDKIVVKGEYLDKDMIMVGGSKLNDKYMEEAPIANSLPEDYIKFVDNNPSSILAAYMVAYRLYFLLETEEMREQVAKLEGEAKECSFTKYIEEVLTIDEQSLPGAHFTEVVLNGLDGKELKLSSVVGKGRPVIMHFGATWSGTCRRDSEDLKKMQQQYKKLGVDFDVYYVACEDKISIKQWKKDIEEFGYQNWYNVVDYSGWESKAMRNYSVKFLPNNFLFDGNGYLISNELKSTDLTPKLDELIAPKQTEDEKAE